jgi:PadR family transcriptional regulator, regulatory protein AphA
MPRPNTSRIALLGLLAARPATGYELRRVVRTSLSHFWSESYGQIYPTLRALVRAGLATVAERAGPGRPIRRQYRISARGRAELARWLAAPGRPATVRDELQLRVWLAHEGDPLAVADQLRREAEDQARRLARWQAAGRAGDDDPNAASSFAGATLRLASALAGARIAWCEQTARELEAAVRRDARGERAEKG